MMVTKHRPCSQMLPSLDSPCLHEEPDRPRASGTWVDPGKHPHNLVERRATRRRNKMSSARDRGIVFGGTGRAISPAEFRETDHLRAWPSNQMDELRVDTR